MSDYLGPESGFVIDSHPEPAAWPHEKRQRLMTTWGRIVWTSLRDQIRASYVLAVSDPAAYAELSRSSRRCMRQWAGRDAVAARLEAALSEVVGQALQPTGDPEVGEQMVECQPQRAAA